MIKWIDGFFNAIVFRYARSQNLPIGNPSPSAEFISASLMFSVQLLIGPLAAAEAPSFLLIERSKT